MRRPTPHGWWVIGFIVLYAALLAMGAGLTHVARESDAQRHRIDQQIQQGISAHVALCAQRADLKLRIAQNELYLRLTHAQRVRRYGEALGSIPPATIRASIVNAERTLLAYRDLGC